MDMTRYYPVVVTALAISASMLACAHAAPAPAGPSFDCKTHKAIWEMAVCNLPRLTELDRTLDKSYRGALKGIDGKSQKLLREDQKKFLSGLDRGFSNTLTGGELAGPEEQEKALKEAVADSENSAILGLEGELKARIEMLDGADARRKGFVGIWRNTHAKLVVRENADKPGTYKGEFRYAMYGWAKYNCVLKLEFSANGKQLSAAGAYNDDAGDDFRNTVVLSLEGSVLHLKEAQAEESRFNGWSCPQVTGLDEAFIAVRDSPEKPAE
jgi:uncharacterized protein YecT (DUF1311 family)